MNKVIISVVFIEKTMKFVEESRLTVGAWRGVGKEEKEKGK